MRSRRIAARVMVAACAASVGARSSGAQVSDTPALPDSGRPLPFAEFAARVLATHPAARQARLGAEQARGAVLEARGAFDPTLSASLDQKAFLGSTYFNYLTAEAKVPLPVVGSDVKLAYERASGPRIAADRYTPRAGIFKLGLGVPLGQRVLTDERRNALAIARAQASVADGEQRASLNKLLLSAAKDYAAWYEASRVLAVAQEGVQLAEFRLVAVRARVARGEAAPIDTVEARLEVQRRLVARYEAERARYATALGVSAYLWDERASPIALPPDAAPTAAGLEPAPLDSAALPAWLRAAVERHPDVVKAEAKEEGAAAGRTFARQGVIPFAEVTLNSIAPQRDVGALASPGGQSYALGGSFKSPLLFMKERGKLRQADAKLEAQELDVARARRDVELDVRATVNELSTLVAVLDVQRLAVSQASQLLRGEQRRFEQGESSLLVVNLRERAVLEARQKLAELEAKYIGTRAALGVAVGDLSERIARASAIR